MGTCWSARIVDAPPECSGAIDAVLNRVIDQMSNWEAASDISRFNAAPVGQWIALPADMMKVLRAGVEIARISNGAFDPAVGRMVDRWGFGPGGVTGPAVEPSHASPWTAIEIDGEKARRLANVALDFSGIAK
ncbi:MAG TPA: FAD:protein FMN transferase, partial [Sphingobium sp.]